MADDLYDDEQAECPLCMEPFSVDDLNFFPCSCRYQICRFCWHRIRTDENGLCPACREPYSEDPAEYTPPSQEQIAKLKSEKRQKSHDKKQKLVESRRNLADVRVVQKNLVFVIGLSSRLADAETLKRQDYFGKYGKIHKVVINHSTVYNGAQGPSVSAYVTYYRNEDAKKAIQNVNNAYIDGRFLKASFGTTKYCSHFLRGLQCPKPDCMYLHELGDEDASFTKQDMLLGKHQDYEQATLSAFSQAMNVSVTHKQPVKEHHHEPHHQQKGGWKRSQPPRMKQLNKARNDQQAYEKQLLDAESALPSSALWAKQENEPGYKPTHSPKQHSHSKHLQRTHSHPASATTHTQHGNRASSHTHSNPSSRRGSKGSEGDRSREGSISGTSSKMGSPDSINGSVESLKNLTFSGGSTGEYVGYRKGTGSGGGAGLNQTTVTTQSNRTCSEMVEYEEEEEEYEKDGEEHVDISPVGNNAVVLEGNQNCSTSSSTNSSPLPLSSFPVAAEVEEVLTNKGQEHTTSEVLQNFGSAMSSGFGCLGVSWNGQAPVSSTTTNIGDTHSQTTSGVLGISPWMGTDYAGLPTAKDGGTKNINYEQQRIASAYVNYGPTTNNGLAELAARESTQHTPEGPAGGGGGRMLQSSLEDKFKVIYPSQMPSAFPYEGESAGRYQQWPSGNRLSSHINQPSSLGLADHLITRKQDHNTAIPPPPGFAPQTREMATASRYSLWGTSRGGSERDTQRTVHHSSSYPNTLATASTQTATPSQRVIPGTIQHSVLEASLFGNSSWAQGYYPYNYLGQQPVQQVAGTSDTSSNRLGQSYPQHHPTKTSSQQSYPPSYLSWNGLSGIGMSTGLQQHGFGDGVQGQVFDNQLTLQNAQSRSMRRN